MKEITIQIDETLLSGLNNALIAYWDVVWSIYLGCDVSTKFEKLKSLSEDELKARVDAVKHLYEQIEKELN